MSKCTYKDCIDDAAAHGYCDYHYRHFIKGDKIAGLYCLYLHLSDGIYFYVGKASLQGIQTEINKKISEMRTGTGEKKLIQCFKRLREEHSDLTADEICRKYVTFETFDEYPILGGELVSLSSKEITVDDKRRAYLSNYENNLKHMSLNGVIGDSSGFTPEHREILKFNAHTLKLNEELETKTINAFIEKHDKEFCLNMKKIKK